MGGGSVGFRVAIIGESLTPALPSLPHPLPESNLEWGELRKHLEGGRRKRRENKK